MAGAVEDQHPVARLHPPHHVRKDLQVACVAPRHHVGACIDGVPPHACHSQVCALSERILGGRVQVVQVLDDGELAEAVTPCLHPADEVLDHVHERRVAILRRPSDHTANILIQRVVDRMDSLVSEASREPEGDLVDLVA